MCITQSRNLLHCRPDTIQSGWYLRRARKQFYSTTPGRLAAEQYSHIAHRTRHDKQFHHDGDLRSAAIGDYASAEHTACRSGCVHWPPHLADAVANDSQHCGCGSTTPLSNFSHHMSCLCCYPGVRFHTSSSWMCDPHMLRRPCCMGATCRLCSSSRSLSKVATLGCRQHMGSSRA